MWKNRAIGWLWFIASLVLRAHGFSGGAAPDACTGSAMIPTGHPTPGDIGESPYEIKVEGDPYRISAERNLTVTLSSSESFKGFLILALPIDEPTGSPVGSFSIADGGDPSTVKDACSGGMTHTSSSEKMSVKLKWQAPADLIGNIVFYVTFVKTQPVYWAKQPSIPVWDGQSASPPTVAPTAAGPQEAGVVDAITQDGCGDSKSCYSSCDGDKCDFLLTWKKDGTKVEFSLFGSLSASQGYLALGLGKTERMSEVSIVGCTSNNDVQMFYASDQVTPTPSTEGPINVNSAPSSLNDVDGLRSISCSFIYDNDVGKDQAEWKDLNGDLYAFIARGSFNPPSVLSQHDKTPTISPDKINFLSDDFVDIGGSRINQLIKAHACFMILAWVFCASIGVILARYYKPMWTETKACGQKVWFSYHRALMLCAMFLTIIGFVLILINHQGEFRLPRKLPTRAHPVLGLIAIIFVLLNPIIAAFRCHPGESKRPLFNWVHWFVGTVAHVFAIVAIFLGMLISSVGVPAWITYIMMAFCLFHVCVEFMLEIHQCCMYDRNRDRQESYQSSNKEGQEPKYVGRGFKCAVLGVYLVVVSVITIALIIIIAIYGSVVPLPVIA